MKKRLLAILLAAAMVVGLCPAEGMTAEAAAAESAETDKTATSELRVTDVSLGICHSAAITEDGSLWVWGRNENYQWGDGTRENCSYPKKIMDGVKEVRAGNGYTMALKEDGSLWLCGVNFFETCAPDVDRTVLTHPTKIMEDVKSIYTGYVGSYYCEHYAVIKTDGSLWAWGNNLLGQVGNGTSANWCETPVKIMDNVKAVSLDSSNCAAITEDGSLWTWGYNGHGQLGDGTMRSRAAPEKIMDGVKSVSLSGGGGAALKEDGSLWMWGDIRRIGNVELRDEVCSLPVKVAENVKDFNWGNYTIAVVKNDGSLWMCGSSRNGYGFPGLAPEENSEVDKSVNVYPPQKFMDEVEKVYADSIDRGAVIKEDGSLWMWGSNDYGQIGDGTTEERNIPVKVLGPGSSYKSADDVSFSLSDSTRFFSDASGSVGGDIAKAYPGEYNLKFPLTKTSYTKESMGDGCYKFKAAFGIMEDSAIVFSDTYWNNLKKDIEDAANKVNKTGQLAALMKKHDAQTDSFTLTDSFKAQPDISAMGYYEAILDENGAVISDTGKLIIDSEWSASTTRPFTVEPIPVYMGLEGSLKAGGAGQVTRKSTGDMSLSGNISMTPGMAPEAGIGINGVATVGVKGSAELGIQLIPESKGDLTAGVAITAKLLSMYDEEFDIAKATYHLWPNEKVDNLKQPPLKGSAGSDPEPEITFASRDYQDKTSAWNGSAGNQKLRGAAGNGLTLTELQSYILPDTIPQMKTVGDDTVMVFQSCDADRAAQNSIKLMYSVYDGKSWSEPAALWDNGTLDAFADLEQVGDDLYVVWQKCREEITSTDVKTALSRTAQCSEICYSKYDAQSGTFGEAAYITDDSTLDMMPHLVKGSTTPAVVWASSPDNDLAGMKGTKAIKVSVLNGGSFGEPETLGSTDDYISELDGIYADGTYRAALLHTDAKSNPKLSLAAGGSMKTIVSGDDAVMSGLKCLPGMVTYTEDGTWQQYRLADGTVSEVKAGENANISSNVVNVSQGDKNALIWMRNDEEGCHFYASMEGEQGYSEPAEIYCDENVDGKYFTAALDADGDWQIVYSAGDKDNDDRTSMYFVTKEMAPRAEIGGVLINENELDGMTQPISYTVTNNGEESIMSLNLTVKDVGQTLLSKKVSCNIKPGETQYFEDEVELKSTSGTQELTVQAVAGGQLETTDTSLTEEIRLSDFSLDVKKQVKSDGVEFTAIVTNTGQVTAGGSVSFYGDKDGKRRLGTQSFAPIAPGETANLTFTYNAKDMQYTDDTSMYCMMKAETDTEEFNEMNNNWYGVTYLWELPETVQNQVKYAAVPSGLAKAKATTTSIKLSWKKTGGASGYEVYRRTYGSKTFKKVKTITKASTTSFTNTKLTAGQYYQYRIRAYKTVNGKPVYSSYSKILTASTTLAVPTLSRVTSLKKKQATVTWKKVKGATGYQVYRSTSKNGKYKKVATVKAARLSCTDKKVSSKKKYYYKVRAYRTANKKTVYSGWSKVRSARAK